MNAYRMNISTKSSEYSRTHIANWRHSCGNWKLKLKIKGRMGGGRTGKHTYSNKSRTYTQTFYLDLEKRTDRNATTTTLAIRLIDGLLIDYNFAPDRISHHDVHNILASANFQWTRNVLQIICIMIIITRVLSLFPAKCRSFEFAMPQCTNSHVLVYWF